MFQVDVAAFAEPSVLTVALPVSTVSLNLALAVVIAVVGAALQGAVLAVVTCKAESFIFCLLRVNSGEIIASLPLVHKHVPFEQTPWSWHLGSHSLVEQAFPVHPSWQTHLPDSHSP